MVEQSLMNLLQGKITWRQLERPENNIFDWDKQPHNIKALRWSLIRGGMDIDQLSSLLPSAFCLLPFFLTLCCLSTTKPVTAQISADHELPHGQTVVLPGTIPKLDFVITGGTQVGSNLFHSFAEFSIPTGGSAIFQNDPGIQNIINRVTGGSKSNIDGLIQANGNANLFLINPNGVIFGPNASLNIGGSFTATTANSLKLSNGDEFSATHPTPPLLTVSVPLGLQFGSNPADIQVEGLDLSSPGSSQLRVLPFKTLALIGGNISVVDQFLVAPGGRVELGSVGDSSFVSLTPTSQGFAFGYAGVQELQTLQLDGSLVSVSGPGGGNVQIQGQTVQLNQTQVFANTAPTGTQSGGGITIRGNQLFLDNSTVQTITFASVQGSDITFEAGKVTITGPSTVVSAETQGSGKGGNLTITADDVELANLSLLGTQTTGTGATGDVTIETDKLGVRGGAQIAVNVQNQGFGGNLRINARDSIDLVGEANLFGTTFSSGLSAQTNGSGKAGDVIIETGKLSVQDGARISASTFDKGDAGNVVIKATEAELIGTPTASEASGVFSQVESGATGQGGSITFATNSLRIQGGAQISTSTFGAGNAGNISVVAPDWVEVQGDGTNTSFSGLFAQVETGATGRGGNVRIDTRQLTLQGKRALLSASTDDVGFGGDVNINTTELLLSDGAQIQAATRGIAPGGKVEVNAQDTVQLIGTSTDNQSNSGIFTSTLGHASAGNLSINTGNLFIQDGARVSASTFGDGSGGNVTVNASRAVKLIGTSPNGQSSSGLFVQATGSGKAGNINLTANSLLLDQRGEILAESAADNGGEIALQVANILQIRHNSLISATAGTASGQGNGGNININTAFLVAVPSENSDITANAFRGRGGNINITAQGVFGIEFRKQQTSLSDITASSTFGVNGVVEINTLDVDPTKGLAILPQQLTDVSSLITQSCKAQPGRVASRFVVIGRGGLPPSPESIFSSDPVLPDLATTPISAPPNLAKATVSPFVISPPTDAIIEAQAIVVNSKGEVFLTVEAPTVTPHNSWLSSKDCHGS